MSLPARPPARGRVLLSLSSVVALALAAVGLLLLPSGRAQAALTNPGFEMGDLTGWTTGAIEEGVFVVGSDTINAGEGLSQAPLEGDYMARLGNAEPSKDENQPKGPNELVQTFTIDGPRVKFAYNIWTYDYTGYDEFKIDLRLVASDTVIYSYMQQAWGASGDRSRKNSGWQIVNIPVTLYQGQQARLTISAGGSRDNLYAFWAYIDSAENVVPAHVVDFPGLLVNGFHPSQNSADHTIDLTRRPSSGTWYLEVPVLCPDGSTPASVSLIVGSTPAINVPLTKAVTSNVWGGQIPTPPGTTGQKFPLTLVVDCPPTTITINIGSITLTDPSGFITDAQTTLPIPEATVTLQRLEGSTWVTVNPYALIEGHPTVAPQVNPELTDDTGHYAWDVMDGTYRVVVEKTGYASQTSYQVTVPPPVLDLNLALVPTAQLRSGDVDCNTTADSIDALKVLLYLAHIGADPPCLAGANVDCGPGVDSVDALFILRHVALLPVTLPNDCPDIGDVI